MFKYRVIVCENMDWINCVILVAAKRLSYNTYLRAINGYNLKCMTKCMTKTKCVSI